MAAKMLATRLLKLIAPAISTRYLPLLSTFFRVLTIYICLSLIFLVVLKNADHVEVFQMKGGAVGTASGAGNLY